MLRELYEQIAADISGHRFTARPINAFQGAYLAVDSQQRPALFMPTTGSSSEPPLRTAQVSLRLSGRFTITPNNAEPVTGTFDCLACEATEAPAIQTFLVLVESFVAHQPSDITISEFFRTIVRLFAMPAARDLTAERQGLWGELFMMRTVNGFAFWAPFWHTEPTRRFDFSSIGKRVEVKTALEGPRIHHFGHRQIYPVPGEEIVVASLLVTYDDAGMSLRDLILECRRETASTPQFMSLERAVRRAGMDDGDETGPKFDPTAAAINLAWFDSQDVPHFQVPEPPGVSDTRYRVDLSTAPPLDEGAVTNWLQNWQLVGATP